MSIHPIADALESARTVMESGFPDAMLLTDARTMKIKELEKKIEGIEAKNALLCQFLSQKKSQIRNMKEVYPRQILRLHINLTDISAGLDTKTKEFENVVVENIKLGIEIGKQAAIISEFERKKDNSVPSAAQSQQTDNEKTTNTPTQNPQTLTAQNFWNIFHAANPLAAEKARQLTQMPPKDLCSIIEPMAQQPTPTFSPTPPAVEVPKLAKKIPEGLTQLAAREPTPPPPTQVATRKRGRPRKNIGPLDIILPPASRAISGHSSAVADQTLAANALMLQSQEPGTSGSGSSGDHDSKINWDAAEKSNKRFTHN